MSAKTQALKGPASLWRDTAVRAPSFDALQGNAEADVAIVGAGYTGLSAALRAIERGLRPAVLEAGPIGFGASGRNGGVVSTKYRVSLADMAKAHGLDVANRMNRLAHDAVESVARYVEDFGLEPAGFARTGNLRCAHNIAALERLKAEAETAADLFGDKSVTVLSADEIAAETGSRTFVGGTLNRDAGVIHPLNYLLGLANGVADRGGRIFERSAATAIARNGATIEIRTGSGTLKAGRLILATDAYSDTTPATASLRTAIIPFRSAIIATAPLSADVRAKLVPGGRGCSETRRMMRWFRPVGDRLVFGGRGAFGKDDSASAYLALETAMKRIFPQLESVEISHKWSGLVSMTLNSLPQIGLGAPGSAFAIGYNGAGVAMASFLGRQAVDLVLGDEPDLALMRRERPLRIPLYRFREPAVRTVAGWYQVLDRIGL